LVPRTVLLVEDDHMLGDAVRRSLSEFGYLVQMASTAMDGLRLLNTQSPDIVVLDLGLPDLDGGDALRMMRGVSNVPVMVATANRDELRIIQLLNAGADDYLVKPFSTGQLIARVSAVLRRSRSGADAAPQVLAIGGLRVDIAKREASLDGRLLDLNRKEFDVLAFLTTHTDRVVTRAELVKAVWGRPHSGSEQSVDVHISWLRRKLGESAATPRYLHTVRGVGVRLIAPS
jgi:DNA-binding response OmpR family regulator